jgi:hypothetical protein
LLGVTCVLAALVAGSVATYAVGASAVEPKPGRWSGGISNYIGHGSDSVRFRVTRSGDLRQVTGPTYGPSTIEPDIPRVNVSRKGTFSATRKYRENSPGSSRGYDFTVRFSGRFITKTKAKGTLVVDGIYSDARGVRVPEDTYKTNWNARHKPCWPYDCNDPDRPRRGR